MWWCRGEAYYPRSAVAELHTAERWLRAGREVLQAELGAPYKTIARRGSASSRKGSAKLDEVIIVKPMAAIDAACRQLAPHQAGPVQCVMLECWPACY